MKTSLRDYMAIIAISLLAMSPLTLAYTRTKTEVGTNTATGSNGGAVTTTYTSYYIYMNDNNKVSTFVGVPKTTTDKNGNPSVYLSPELLLAPTEDVQTFNRPQSPTATTGPTKTSSKDDASASQSAPSTKSEPSSVDSDAGAGAGQKSTNVAAIAGGAAAGVAVLFALGIGGWVYRRKYIRKKEREEHHKEELQLLTLQIDGTYLKKDTNDSLYFSGSRGRGSFTDDLASMYTGGTLTRNQSSLQHDAHSYVSSTPMGVVGVELTMDSQGRHGLPDGSPLIIDSIKPVRNMKVSDKYADLEWFPLVTSQSTLEHHAGPSYVEDREMSHVATSAQKPAGQKGVSPVGILQRKP
ncbi:hypothetical protein GGI16_004213 [Coemansia sp. S142-1]|nr:hypothetical protein GGI16_004213 [Coemansia sp. S142-1]